jgi:tetratricopeptide (TPR) repeat protein/SAM-dependent methyltransferase
MGEKKRRLSAGGPFDGRLLARAFEALSAGDRARAAEAFGVLRANLPRDPEALNGIGVLGLQLGDPQQAVDPLLRAVAANPRAPAYHCHLAIAYRNLGKPELAVEELETALALDPSLAEAHANLGNLRLASGENAAAEASFARALALRPGYPSALFGQGEARLAQGRVGEAAADFERALAIDPSFHEAHYGLSRARSALVADMERAGAAPSSPDVMANADSALENIVAALGIERDTPAYWSQFERCVKEYDLRHPADSRMRDLLYRALGHSAVDPARLVRPVTSLVATRPDASSLWRRLQAPGGAPEWPEVRDVVRDLFGDAIFRRLLEAVVVPNLFVERLIGFARRGLLREIDGAGEQASLPLPMVAAIAHQCFNTEYVHDESDAEATQVGALRDAIAAARDAGRAVPLDWYGVYACYRPLVTLGATQDASEAIAAELAATPLATLATRQILEPLEEVRLRGTIGALTEVVDDVSAAVRNQYEENPYPRWVRIERDVAQSSVGAFLRGQFPRADLAAFPEGPARILVAGCGTGRHPIGTARRFPESSVLAVDLSLTSLAYAVRKTRELGIRNIEYRQADLLLLGTLPERFDVVDSTGVLHHLEDPVAGWRVLCALLRPGGAMRVGLYSELARRHVVRARELIAASGFAPTPSGIRACRAAILARQDDPLLARVARGEDFYSLSGCRDLLFHVQETRFTLPRIAEVLRELGLEFIGFEWPDADTPGRYRDRFPDDPGQTDLDRWHRFETDRPDTFVLMYQFWVRKPA